MSTVRLRRLQADYEKLREFLLRQPRVRLIQAHGTPPERYQLEYQIKGLRQVDDQLQTVANHVVEIMLPLSYPRLPPQCRMLTPVFHPNIAPHAICIGDHWSAGEALWSMVARIGEMIAYQTYNTKSPLNGEAARWVEGHQGDLPLDRTIFGMDDLGPAAPEGLGTVGNALRGVPGDGTPRRAFPTVPESGSVGDQPQPPPVPRPMEPPPVPPTYFTRPIPVAKLVEPSPPRPDPSADGHASAPAEILLIQCGRCSTRYRVPAQATARRVRCKTCQGILEIPARPAGS